EYSLTKTVYKDDRYLQTKNQQINHMNKIYDNNYIKRSITCTLVKTALMLVSITGSLTTAQATGGVAAMHHRMGSGEGYLLVYSATDESSDGDLEYYAHSSYAIYTASGKFLRNVENHMSRSDEIPELVTLPAGSYIVEARSA